MKSKEFWASMEKKLSQSHAIITYKHGPTGKYLHFAMFYNKYTHYNVILLLQIEN